MLVSNDLSSVSRGVQVDSSLWTSAQAVSVYSTQAPETARSVEDVISLSPAAQLYLSKSQKEETSTEGNTTSAKMSSETEQEKLEQQKNIGQQIERTRRLLTSELDHLMTTRSGSYSQNGTATDAVINSMNTMIERLSSYLQQISGMKDNAGFSISMRDIEILMAQVKNSMSATDKFVLTNRWQPVKPSASISQ